MKSMLETIKALAAAAGPSGAEDSLFKTVKMLVKESGAKVEKDKMGNIIVIKRGNRRGRVAFFTHNDEIGLIITKIDRDYLRFTEVGGYDEKVLLGQEVIVYGKKEIRGIIGAKPPHLQTKGESDKFLKFEDLYIDVGMKNKDILKYINVGDRVIIRSDFTEMKQNTVCVKALDNRASGATVLYMLKYLENVKNHPDVYLVLNSQEETTMAGSKVSAHAIDPDVAFVLDVTFAKQTGFEQGYPLDRIGFGMGANICKRIFDFVKKTADDNNVQYFIEPLPSMSGTDAYAVQTVKKGVTTMLISLPIRNMHSPVEIASVKTMEEASRFLSLLMSNIKTEEFKERILK
ncbi:MAG: M20/M25/M40 family metallo-hydrolase [bacterium]|nr:M20/M25/M40 family metallo-hydrolase [bacterium]